MIPRAEARMDPSAANRMLSQAYGEDTGAGAGPEPTRYLIVRFFFGNGRQNRTRDAWILRILRIYTCGLGYNQLMNLETLKRD